MTWRMTLMVSIGLLVAACGQAAVGEDAASSGARSTTTRTVSPSTSTTVPTPPPRLVANLVSRANAPVFESIQPPTEPRPHANGWILPREVTEQVQTAFARVGAITLFHPSSSVELIGYHESNHDGAQNLEPLDTSAPSFTMTSRDRGTGPRTAADVVVQPEVPIVAPVTGVVLRAGSYTLYCDYRDHFVVIEPDDQPGWEVKVLHFLDLQVSRGDRVEGGSTIIGSGPRPLAFRSQVDDASSAPSWPHVHIEVVDPSIPDRPSSTSC